MREVHHRVKNNIANVDSLLSLRKELHEVFVKDYAEGLIDSLVTFFDPENRVRIEKQLGDFTIPAKQATAVGIIRNKLLTNVFKYAFGDREKGMVTVSINKEESEVTLIIQDNGVGFTIVKMLVEQFNGSCSLSNCNGAKIVVGLKI